MPRDADLLRKPAIKSAALRLLDDAALSCDSAPPSQDERERLAVAELLLAAETLEDDARADSDAAEGERGLDG